MAKQEPRNKGGHGGHKDATSLRVAGVLVETGLHNSIVRGAIPCAC
jgi:hypothetical protein